MAGTVVICFTDIVGSTALLSRVGDDAFDSLRRSHFDLLARQVEDHGGDIVKNLGDGVMVAFGSASDAVAAAVAMQRAVDTAARTAGADAIAIRVGISAGDASFEDGDWFGAPVVEGARLCAAADSGQILVSEVVRLLAGNRGGHELVSLGERELKGLAGPLAVSEVRWIPAKAASSVSLPGPLTPTEGELPFSGRRESFELVLDAWKATASGEPRIVLIGGEPGVGKTRLVSELARSVHADGALVLLGRADEHVDAPYGPWREALRGLVRSVPDAVIDAHVTESGGDLARLVPELARRVDTLPPPTESDAETERLLLYEAVVGLLELASADTPVLLVLDDLHWADRSSLLLLLHVLRMDRPATLLVVATYRDTDVDRSHPLSSVLADLRRVGTATRVSLGGLDDAGIVELLEGAGGYELDAEARAFASTLWRETEGNPFFIGEVLRHLIESGGLVQAEGRWRASATLDQTGLPEGVREVIGRRLADLPADTNKVLGVASVLGREFDVSLVAAVADLPLDEVFESLTPAESARLIDEAPGLPGRYSFSHALVRTTLSEELGTNRRIRLHRAAGLALEALADPPLGELAFHFGEAAVMGETDRAVRYARAAAEQALALAAPEEAAALTRRALQAVELADGGDAERAPLLVLLAGALEDAGSPEAGDIGADAVRTSLRAGDAELAARAAVALRGLQFYWGDERASLLLEETLAALGEGDSEERSLVLARLSFLAGAQPGDVARRLAQESYDIAVRIDSAPGRQAAANSASVALRNLDRPRMLAFAQESISLQRGDFGATALTAYSLAFEALLGMGDIDGARDALVSLREKFESSSVRGLLGVQTWHDNQQALGPISLALIAGDLDAVERVLADTARDPHLAVNIGMQYTLHFGRLQLDYLRGDFVAAAKGWKLVEDIVPGMMDVYFGFSGEGSPLADLRVWFDHWMSLADTRPDATRASNVTVVLNAMRRLGERELSASYAEQFLWNEGCYLTNTALYFHGPYELAFGVGFTTAGQLDRAVGYLERAIQQCEAVHSPTFGTISTLELATTLAVRGDAGDADRSAALAAEAWEVADRLGMHGWRVRVERLQAGDLEPWRIEGVD